MYYDFGDEEVKTITYDFSENIKKLEIHIFADEHLGDKQSDIKNLKSRINKVAKNPNAYCILNGDIMDNATKTSIGDIYDQTKPPMGQLKQAEELFKPIKHKTLGMTTGNHEERTSKKEGIDISQVLARNLGVEDKYSPDGIVVYISFGQTGRKPDKTHKRKQSYCIYATHGSGGGKKEGSKINSLIELSGIIDADVYVHSHTHLPATTKIGLLRSNYVNKSAKNVEKLFVNTASNLKYGGYGKRAGYKPASRSYPVIYLYGNKKFTQGLL